jgi:hypothetical protein
MVLGPGKIFGTFFAIAALIVAVTTIVRIQVSMRMQCVNGVLADDADGSKDISYTIGHIGSSKGNTVNVRVRYGYQVQGREYEGHILTINGNSYATFSEDKVKELISQLTSSPQIRVWYDPKHPEFSVIVEPKLGIEWMWLGSLVLLALLSIKYLDRVVIRLQSINKATG